MSSSRALRIGILRRREVEILGELLRNGAGAARELHALEVDLHRLLELLEVDAAVLPERRVFGHDHGALQARRDASVVHPALHAARRLALVDRLALAQLDERRGRRILRAQDAHVGKRQVDVRGARESNGEEHRDDSPSRAHPQAAAHVTL